MKDTSTKSILSFLVMCILIIQGCKPKQKDIVSSVKTEQPVATSKTIGKVSHQYKATGCATVIVIADVTKPLVLIPKDKLDAKLDIEGLEISFNYRKLKMPQPAGCTTGIPAELTDITKK